MSMLSSLSVWSSVKFPFPKFYEEIKQAKTSGVKSCNDLQRRDHEKVRGDKATEVVNLTVPWSQNFNKEKSVPNLYCETTRNQKKTKKKNKHVKIVTVPEIVFYEKETVEKFPDIQATNHECESDLISGNKYRGCQPEEADEKDEENTCIPSVKPWTLEELMAINRKIEEGEKKIKIRRSKGRGNMIKNHVRESESFLKLLLPDESFTPSNFTPCHGFLPFTRQFTRNVE